MNNKKQGQTMIMVGAIIIALVLEAGLVAAGASVAEPGSETALIISSFYVFPVILLMLANMITEKIIHKKYKDMKSNDSFDMFMKKKDWARQDAESARKSVFAKYIGCICYAALMNLLIAGFPFFSGMFVAAQKPEDRDIIFDVFLLIVGTAGFVLTIGGIINNLLTRLFYRNNQEEETQYPELNALIQEILTEEGIDVPFSANIFWATSNCGVSEYNGKLHIGFGSLMLKFLSNEEIKAILYHEIAHYKHNDTKYSLKVEQLQEVLSFLLPSKLTVFMCPMLLKTALENHMIDESVSIIYENMADDEVIKKNVHETYVTACCKMDALDRVSNRNFAYADYKIDIDGKWTDETIEYIFREIEENYNLHKDFFEQISNSYLEERLSTHPNIRQRKEKFNVTNVDFSIKRNNTYDNAIMTYIGLCNKQIEEQKELYKEHDERFVRQYEGYLQLKEREINGEFENDLDRWHGIVDMAMNSGDYDEAKKLCRKILEVNPESDRANATLGIILAKHDFSDECIGYLEKVIADQSSFSLEVLEVLGEFYVITGNVAGRDHIREVQFGVIDEDKDYSESMELNMNDKFSTFEDREVRSKVLDIVKNCNEIESVSFVVKKVGKYTCTHVIVWLNDKNSNQSVDECMQAIFSYLDTLKEQYNLHSMCVKDIANNHTFRKNGFRYTKEGIPSAK